MNIKNTIITIIVLISFLVAISILLGREKIDSESNGKDDRTVEMKEEPNQAEIEKSDIDIHPMDLEMLSQKEYPGGDLVVEQALENGTNYRQYIVSYSSEGLKIYGLLTIPLSVKPQNGFPAVLFVHGYIPPKQYSTTGNYPTYQAALARSNVITFKPDLRGHGNSEGEPVSAHFSEKYLVDVMNAISYLKDYPDVDPGRIGYWGHSNGGETGLRTLVISSDIKAASLWAGVVGSFEDELETYNEKIPFMRNPEDNELVRKHGWPSENPQFWSKIDPYYHLDEISVPVQLHHGTADASVPIELSRELKKAMEEAGKEVEMFEYPGDDHNIGANSGLAWRRTINFFRNNL